MHITAHFTQQNLYESPLLASLKILMEQYPKDKFTFFVETILTDLPKNCTQKTLSPKPKNNFLLYFWYKFRLHSFLKLHNKMIFIGDAGLLCDQSKIPQYLFFNEENFWQDSNPVFKSKFENALVHAKKIFVTENFLADALTEKHAVPKEKIEIVYHGLQNKKVLYSQADIQHIKETNTAGFDYYLYPVSASSAAHVLILLKAFSQLKKMQKTAMKLVLLLQNVGEENLIKDFKNYKYREDIFFVKETTENKIEIVAAANALFYFSDYGIDNTAFTAMLEAVAVVALDNKTNRSIFEDSVLYTDNTEKAITEKMQHLYKDEAAKNNRINHAALFLEKYNAAHAAEQLYKTIYVK
jgi:glycosyltransferase involved in cell wall biosynthesis